MRITQTVDTNTHTLHQKHRHQQIYTALYQAVWYGKLDIIDALKIYTDYVDGIVQAISACFDLQDIVIFAVGSYGRCELFLHSDLDLLIIDERKNKHDHNLGDFIATLWDAGFKPSTLNYNQSTLLFGAKIDTNASSWLHARRLHPMHAPKQCTKHHFANGNSLSMHSTKSIDQLQQQMAQHSAINYKNIYVQHIPNCISATHIKNAIADSWTLPSFLYAKLTARRRLYARTYHRYNIKTHLGALHDAQLLQSLIVMQTQKKYTALFSAQDIQDIQKACALFFRIRLLLHTKKSVLVDVMDMPFLNHHADICTLFFMHTHTIKNLLSDVAQSFGFDANIKTNID